MRDKTAANKEPMGKNPDPQKAFVMLAFAHHFQAEYLTKAENYAAALKQLMIHLLVI